MKCWSCAHPIRLEDEIALLPIVNTLVHRRCFERETGAPSAMTITLSQYLARRVSDAA